jgi:hypothetical protein
MLVMHFMCPANATQITIVDVPEKPESLMNKNIMNQEITKSVECNTDAQV